MKPAPFDYHAATNVDEAIEFLGAYGDEAKILGGGQSLVPMMNMRLARPSALIDITRIRDLDGIVAGADTLEIGAAVRQAEVLAAPEVRKQAPLLAEMLRWVGHEANRSRGTVVGSVAHADPAAEVPAALLALDGEVVVEGPRGRRLERADGFFQGFFTTVIQADELATAVRIPVGQGSRRWGFAEVARRHGDYAMTGVAAVLDLDDDDAVAEARVVLMSMADVPLRAASVERALVGRRLDASMIDEAVAAVATEGDPGSDVHASARYRRHAAAVLTRRVLQQCIDGGTSRVS